ncbi:TonB-dependent receptor [uncultured Desulfobacterium sp.]|uniref:TonB-dependent receptor n=1 Tax=uncultured Desulfobacterium sp. TaxID=201089 RepID=A0A445N248_9BACT|nr:TonB-dependent receptor [uncultured Desulfobacterium sp.]
MKLIKCSLIILMLTIGILAANPFLSLVYAQNCEKWVAKIVSVQGAVEVCRADDTRWAPVKLNDTFCPGDMIRVLKMGRAAFVLYNESLVRLDQKTSVTFSGVEDDRVSIIDIIRGAAEFFSRVPRSLKITTPFVNGAVEGTEFYVEVRKDQTLISVFQGRVLAANDLGSISLASNRSAITKACKAPEPYVVARPRDAVRWAIYYPAVIDYSAEEFNMDVTWQARVRASVLYFTAGDLLNAFLSLNGISEPLNDPRFYTYRAGLLLSVGRVDEANMDIEYAFSIDPKDSRAAALKSIIAVARNRRDEALSLAKAAVDNDPNSAAARIALSYALQAHFRLEEALENVKEATTIAPENALAWARLSELWMSGGDLDKALDAAQKAESLNPNLAHTQTVLGFAYLAQINTTDSIAAFEKAIILDQAAPLPRLGLGLAKIRKGYLEEGRREIEIAASLDPDNSLIRSYLGKAFFDEKDDVHAERQYSVAKDLDPNDPTPWFYDGIRKLTINRPVEALQDVQKSIELNDNRAVYRSRLQLDEDLAARSAALGRVYNELGFQELGLVEGWKSVNADPSNYSAHRFLADSYASLPYHEIARVSELLQSQLLQPLNVTPVPAYLAESNPIILEGAGPETLSFNEFNPLFLRNRLALQVSGVGGGNDTLGDDIVQSGVWNKVSYSLSQYHSESEGFRQNNDQDHNVYNAFAQVSVTPKLSLQAEYRYKDEELGYLPLLFHPEAFTQDLREIFCTESVRGGLHYAITPDSDIIASFIYGTSDDDLQVIPGIFGVTSNQYARAGEAQYLFHSDLFNITTGAGYFNADSHDIYIITPDRITEKTTTKHTNVYSYIQLKLIKASVLTLGLSGDFYDGSEGSRDQTNPKVGLTWNPFPGTTLRTAYFKALKRMLIGNQTIEPTQVAGFNQFFDDPNATKSTCYGVGIDQKLSGSLFAGAEFFRRDLKVPNFIVIPPIDQPLDQTLTRFYLCWTPATWLALKLEYQYEEWKLDPQGINQYLASKIQTDRVPLEIGLFHPSGFFLKCRPTYINQDGRFRDSLYTFVPVAGNSSFWVMDASLGYRLPRRLGLISVEARNLFHDNSKFQDTDPGNPGIAPERLILARFTFAF